VTFTGFEIASSQSTGSANQNLAEWVVTVSGSTPTSPVLGDRRSHRAGAWQTAAATAAFAIASLGIAGGSMASLPTGRAASWNAEAGSTVSRNLSGARWLNQQLAPEVMDVEPVAQFRISLRIDSIVHEVPGQDDYQED